MDVKKIASKLNSGDESVLEEISSQYSPLVTTIIYNIFSGKLSTADIEETASDVFLTLWENRSKVIPEKLKGYLCRIAKTKALDRLRKDVGSHPPSLEDERISDLFIMSDNIESSEVYDILREAIKDIGQPDREILIRHYYYYQSTAVIAEKMNINKNTVQTKLRRTREKLRRYLQERGVN